MKTNNKVALLAAASLLVVGTVDAREVDVTFDSDNWGSPLPNNFWNLATGNTFVYLADNDEECVVGRLKVEWTGVVGDSEREFDAPYDVANPVTMVVSDVEWVAEDCEGPFELAERTEDWYAHDNDGNIWYLGEYTEAYDEGGCDIGGSWKAGEDGATPGIVMLANPRRGDRYQQEYYEGEAEDWAKVVKLSGTVSIDNDFFAGDYEGCLVTKESTPLDPGHVEHKFYCPDNVDEGGPGLVYIKEMHGKTVRVEYIGGGLPFGLEVPVTPFPTVDCE